MGSGGDVTGPGPLTQSSAVRTGLAQVFSVTLEPPDSHWSKMVTPSQRQWCVEQAAPGLRLRESFQAAVHPASDLALPEGEGHD